MSILTEFMTKQLKDYHGANTLELRAAVEEILLLIPPAIRPKVGTIVVLEGGRTARVDLVLPGTSKTDFKVSL